MERALNSVVDDALSEVLDLACRLAKHRGGKNLARNDIRVAFEKRMKVRVPYKPPTTVATNILPLQKNAAMIQIEPVSTSSYKAKLQFISKN